MNADELFDRIAAEADALDSNCEECGKPCPSSFARCFSCAQAQDAEWDQWTDEEARRH